MFEKVTKDELSILRRLAMAQEKLEGGLKGPPPPRRGLTARQWTNWNLQQKCRGLITIYHKIPEPVNVANKR